MWMSHPKSLLNVDSDTRVWGGTWDSAFLVGSKAVPKQLDLKPQFRRLYTSPLMSICNHFLFLCSFSLCTLKYAYAKVIFIHVPFNNSP